jgi:MOSC domain-containing protein YiiM
LPELRGLEGDRAAAKAPPANGHGSQRQVTLLQAEHLPLIAAWSGLAQVQQGGVLAVGDRVRVPASKDIRSDVSSARD